MILYYITHIIDLMWVKLCATKDKGIKLRPSKHIWAKESQDDGDIIRELDLVLC